jgi:hypothetical protein
MAALVNQQATEKVKMPDELLDELTPRAACRGFPPCGEFPTAQVTPAGIDGRRIAKVAREKTNTLLYTPRHRD